MSENLYKEAWKYALDEIHNQYIAEDKEREFIFNFNMNYVEDDNNLIKVSVASNFMKNQVITKGSLEIVENKLREITGQSDIKLDCIIQTEKSNSEESKDDFYQELIKNEPEKEKINEPSSEEIFIKRKPVLQEEFTFDTFVPGDNNEYAYKAAIAVAQDPGKKFNPILFYGGSGLGKTHLMKAIGNYISVNNEEKLKICYVTAETFTNDYTNSLVSKKMNEFQNKYRNNDVLLLDDIHFLQNKPALQEALFYTFDELHLKEKQMVFTCDRPIKEIKTMTDRLVSRLGNGLSINLDPPNYETRYAILQKKIELKGKYLEPEIIDYIANNVVSNVRELEAALNRVFGYADLIGKNPTLEIAKSQLIDIFSKPTNKTIKVETIQKVIANAYQVSVSDLKSVKRDKKFVVPRQIAIYLSRELTEMALMEIGNEFGGKDHTTIMHACKKIDDLIKTDPSLDSRIKAFTQEIKEYKDD